MALLELDNISKSYKTGTVTTTVLKDLCFSVERGELVAVMGKSGCGKTTLLNILAGVDYPDSGRYVFNGKDVVIKKAADGISFRRNRIGVILQHFALINDFTVYENIELGLWETNDTKSERRKKVDEVMDRLGILNLKNQYPDKLSGGEKQRVAIGRAIVCNPMLILADEPTGSLDNETEKEIISIIRDLNKKSEMTFIIVTHDEEVAASCNRRIVLQKL